MENEQLIPADDICLHYNVEQTFIQSLNDAGLIQVTTIEERCFIPPSELSNLEKFSNFHYEMNINIEGIEAISHLLEQIKEMQQEMMGLKQRLRIYGEE
ncbi:MAG: chaperone modulator CbpM [Candidatus Dadabacteria bacterium]